MANKTQTTKQTAGAAFEATRSEALRILNELTLYTTRAGRGVEVNWADVGSMKEVVKNLKHAGHWSGIPEFTES